MMANSEGVKSTSFSPCCKLLLFQSKRRPTEPSVEALGSVGRPRLARIAKSSSSAFRSGRKKSAPLSNASIRAIDCFGSPIAKTGTQETIRRRRRRNVVSWGAASGQRSKRTGRSAFRIAASASAESGKIAQRIPPFSKKARNSLAASPGKKRKKTETLLAAFHSALEGRRMLTTCGWVDCRGLRNDLP